MRILHITAYPPTHFGGLELYVRRLSKSLNKSGIHSEVLTTEIENPSPRVEIVDGVKVHFLKNVGELWSKNPIFNVIPYLIKESKNFDIYHVHSYVHLSTFQTIFISKILNKPVILTFHGGVQTNFKYESLSEKIQLFIKDYFFDKILGKFVVDNCDALISVSKSDLLSIGRVFHSKRKENNYWIPNGIELSDSDKKINYNEKTRKGLLYIGRLTSIKGIDLFLEIAEKVNKIIPQIPIIIIGKGDLKKILTDSQKKLNIKYIYEVPNSEIWKYYTKTKVYVLSSRFEGLPTTLLEAMKYKTPIVSTNVGGIPDLIEDGFNGSLYSPTDLDSATKKIIELIKNPNLSKKYIENSQKILYNYFSWDKIVRKNIFVYKKVLAKKKENLFSR